MSEQKKTILYVDDETINLQLFRLTFQSEFEIKTVDTPAEALAQLADNDYAIIISDMKMPKMTGIEFLTQARQLRPQSYRILVTGLLEDEIIETAIKDGVVDSIVHKPWLKTDFTSVLQQL